MRGGVPVRAGTDGDLERHGQRVGAAHLLLDSDEVYDALREDVREQTSADAIEEMMDTATEGRGSFKKVKDSMVTGVTDADEPHAIAVIGAKYDKKSVVFRIAFDTEMNLIGLDVRGK